MQENRLDAYDDNHWDEGTGLAIAGTAALVAGSAAAISAATQPTYVAPTTVVAPAPTVVAPPEPSQFETPPATPAPVLSAPCPNANMVQVGDVTYSQCGATWYTLAYGPNGPTYVQSAPPPGG